jgi:hypothetical protein
MQNEMSRIKHQHLPWIFANLQLKEAIKWIQGSQSSCYCSIFKTLRGNTLV